MNIYIISRSSINPLTISEDNLLPETVEEISESRLTCIEPDYKMYITDPGTRRRMSRVVRMGVTSALQCLSRTTQHPDAIITCTGLGCLGDTEKFLKSIIDNEELLLNPTPFIQSTFNTVAAQIAMITGNHSYNMTYVHRNASFEHCLLDGLMKLKDQEAQHILVGSFEETTDSSFEIESRLGYWKKGVRAGEGSQFFMLSSAEKSGCILRDVRVIREATPENIKESLNLFLEKNKLDKASIDLLISGENGNPEEQIYYQSIENELGKATIIRYKHLFGEYPTVSSLALWLGTQLIGENNTLKRLSKKDRNKTIQRIILYNHFRGRNHSFILLENA